jgi:hypothetical protein
MSIRETKTAGRSERRAMTAFAIKTEIRDPRAKLLAFTAQKTM